MYVMTTASNLPMAATISFIVTAIVLLGLQPTEAQVGVSYGKIADNLPNPQDVINLYKRNCIKTMRLYSPDQATLEALQGTNIKLMLGVPNEHIQYVADCHGTAYRWLRAYVIPYRSAIKYIVVGNEVDPSGEQASYVARAIENLRYVLHALRLDYSNDEIKVSTATNFNLLTDTYPPSNARFKDLSYIKPIIDYMNEYDAPLMINVYPYFAHVNDPQHVSLDFTLFQSPGTVFTDPNNGLGYQNLFDAMVDAIYAALRRAGARHPRVVVSESGHPSRGGFAASLENAKAYYSNLVDHVKQGTPLKPGEPIETYLFAMFDENQKPGADTERNFGLFYPTQESKFGRLNF